MMLILLLPSYTAWMSGGGGGRKKQPINPKVAKKLHKHKVQQPKKKLKNLLSFFMSEVPTRV
jgi:hypothetical protein